MVATSYSKLISEETPIGITLYPNAFTEKGGMPKGKKQHVTYLSLEELASWDALEDPAVKKDKKHSVTFTRGICEGYRKKKFTEAPYLVILDFDKVTRPIAWVSDRLALHGVDHFGYTTHSHGKGGALSADHSFRIITDHVATTWGELRDIVEQLFALVKIETTPESYNTITWFAPVVDKERAQHYEHVESLTGGSSWFPERRNAEEYDRPRPPRERVEITDAEIEKVQKALPFVDPDDGYATWTRVGMALYSTGLDEEAFQLWHDWSLASVHYDYDELVGKWESGTFDDAEVDNPVGVRSIYQLAEANGFEEILSAEEEFEDYERGELFVPPTPALRWEERFSGWAKEMAENPGLVEEYRRKMLEEFNARFFQMPGAVIDKDTPDEYLRQMALRDFESYYTHPMFPHPTRTTGDKDNKEAVYEPAGKLWLAWAHRERYDAMDFLPPGGPERLYPSVFNTWRGFGVEPVEGGNHGYYLDHVHENICNGDDDSYRWTLAWMAHMVQRPWDKVSIALVLKSGQGTGKGVFGEALLKLAGYHGYTVGKKKLLTGNFNAHLMDRIFIMCDEVTWGGRTKDDAAEVLKNLITATSEGVEDKGKRARTARSFAHILINSNKEHVVRMATTDRRFQVFEVGDRHMQDQPYFERLNRALKYRRGYEHLLHHLMALDLDDYPSPKRAFQTAASINQKIESLDHMDRWIHAALDRGYFEDVEGKFTGEWETEVSRTMVFDTFLRACRDVGVKPYAFDNVLGKKLKSLFEARVMRRGSRGEQTRCYVLPPLEVARKMFEEKITQGPIEWSDEAEEEQSDDQPRA